jgi:hypothetical protein
MDMGATAPAGRRALRLVVEGHQEGALHRIALLKASVPVRAWRQRWRASLSEYLHRSAVEKVDRSPEHLVFHQTHMMLNRLGFLPREEVVLGVHARTDSLGSSSLALVRLRK